MDELKQIFGTAVDDLFAREAERNAEDRAVLGALQILGPSFDVAHLGEGDPR